MQVLLPLLLGCLADSPVASEALTVDADAERRVWMFRRTGQTWARSAAPIAHSMSSLGAGIVGESVVLTSQCFWGDCGSVLWRHLAGPPVHAIASTDLETWAPRMWRLADPDDRIPIDTEIRANSDGAAVWYYGTPAGMMGDPAAFDTPHTIFSARVAGDRLVEPVAQMTAPQLADPAPVQFRGQQMVFLTVRPGHEIGLATGDPLAVTRTWTGVSVPHGMVVDDVLWVWAHRVQDGRFVPVRSVSLDGAEWSPWQAVLPTAGVSCGNPVGVVFDGEPVVFCVEETPMPPPGRP
jgi:hypothetical protein